MRGVRQLITFDYVKMPNNASMKAVTDPAPVPNSNVAEHNGGGLSRPRSCKVGDDAGRIGLRLRYRV